MSVPHLQARASPFFLASSSDSRKPVTFNPAELVARLSAT